MTEIESLEALRESQIKEYQSILSDTSVERSRIELQIRFDGIENAEKVEHAVRMLDFSEVKFGESEVKPEFFTIVSLRIIVAIENDFLVDNLLEAVKKLDVGADDVEILSFNKFGLITL